MRALLAGLLALAASPALAAADGGGAQADAGAWDGGADADADAAATPAATDGTATDATATRDARTGAAGDAGPPAPRILLRGRVLEKGTRRPLAGAALTVDAVPAGETGADGRFELAVGPGPHHLEAQMPGHDPGRARLEVAAGDAPVELEVLRLMPRLTGERYETVVQTRREELEQVSVSADEARGAPGTFGDPLRVLASLPGVTQIMWPAALYAIRGANPGNTGFFLDGMRVPALFHLALGPSIIHPYLIGGVDFFPGSAPPAYGRFVSGIVSSRTTPPPTDRAHAAADVTLYDAGGVATAPFHDGRGTVVAAARYSYTGALLSALSSDTLLRYGDYQVAVEHAAGPGRATLFAFGSLDEVGWTQNPFGSGTGQQYARLQFHRVDARWRGAVGGGRVMAGVTAGADWSRSTLFGSPIQVRALSAAPRVTWARTLCSGADVEVGADADLQRFVTAPPSFERRQSDLGRSRSALSQGAFAALTVHVRPRLTVTPGIRGDLFAEQGVRRLVAEPRIDARLRVSDALSLRAGAGRAAQMPSLPVSVPGFEAFGLADLGLQTSRGASLGVDAVLPGGTSATLTGYFQQLRLTDIRDINIASMDPTAPSYLVARDGRSAGVELLLRRPERERLHGWLAYTLSRSERADDNGVFGRSDWDQRHILNLVAGYRLPRGWSVGARFHVHSGRRAPIIGSGGQYRQLPTFYQLDLRGQRRFTFDRFLLDAYVDLGNATFQREVVQLEQGVRSATNEPYVVEESFHIILPTIGLHAEF